MPGSIKTVREMGSKLASLNRQHLVIVVFAILLMTVPLGAGPYSVTIMIDIGFYAIVTMGLILLMGFTGQISLGQAVFFGLGAYGSSGAEVPSDGGITWVVSSPSGPPACSEARSCTSS